MLAAEVDTLVEQALTTGRAEARWENVTSVGDRVAAVASAATVREAANAHPLLTVATWVLATEVRVVVSRIRTVEEAA